MCARVYRACREKKRPQWAVFHAFRILRGIKAGWVPALSNQQRVDPFDVGRWVGRHPAFGQKSLVEQDVRQVIKVH